MYCTIAPLKKSGYIFQYFSKNSLVCFAIVRLFIYKKSEWLLKHKAYNTILACLLRMRYWGLFAHTSESSIPEE